MTVFILMGHDFNDNTPSKVFYVTTLDSKKNETLLNYQHDYPDYHFEWLENILDEEEGDRK